LAADGPAPLVGALEVAMNGSWRDAVGVRRRPIRVGGVAAVAAVAACALQQAPAAAAAGSPGTPADPVVVLHETFETGMGPGEVANLPDYRDGVYTAGSYWLDGAQCNGIVVGGSSSDADLSAAGCSTAAAQEKLRAYATRLGELNGSTPADRNHAVSAYTRSQDSPGDRVLFRTAVPVPLPSALAGRFLTGAISTAATACNAAQPRLRFYLETPGAAQDDPPTRTALSDAPLNPCAFDEVDGVTGGRLIGDRSVLYAGSTLQVVIENETTSSNGNDFGFDDVQILDVTPQLDKAFAPSGGVEVGDVVELTFTITNTSERGRKAGWSFVDQLPEGLRVASTAGGSGSGSASPAACEATVSADPGSSQISVTDGVLDDDETACTVTVPVVVERAGAFVNGPDQVSAAGLLPPAEAVLEVAAPPAPPAPTTVPSPAPTTPPAPPAELPLTGGPSSGWGFGLGALAVATVALRRRVLLGSRGR
jgi:uncharacterized repeat protein (TIGR01451 family)